MPTGAKPFSLPTIYTHVPDIVARLLELFHQDVEHVHEQHLGSRYEVMSRCDSDPHTTYGTAEKVLRRRV